MSLILEALRKSEAERRRGTPPQLLDPPLAPSLPPPAPAATRRMPAAGLASIAVAVAVLLGMTGYRMFGAPADRDGAAPSVAATTGRDAAAASPAAIDSARPSPAMQAPLVAAPQVPDALSPPSNTPADSTAATPPVASNAARANPADAAPLTRPAVTTERTLATSAAIDTAQPGTSPTAAPDIARVREPITGPMPTTGATPPSAPARPAPTMPTTARAGRADSEGAATRATPQPTTAAPDRASNLARAMPAPSTPSRGSDRSLSTAPALNATPAAPRTTSAATPAAERPVRLADLPPADRRALPPLRMSMHLFAAAPAERFVILDGQRVGEGDRLGDAVVDEITADGAVLAWRGQRVWVSVR
jgi:general secretion pathway protein B